VLCNLNAPGLARGQRGGNAHAARPGDMFGAGGGERLVPGDARYCKACRAVAPVLRRAAGDRQHVVLGFIGYAAAGQIPGCSTLASIIGHRSKAKIAEPGLEFSPWPSAGSRRSCRGSRWSTATSGPGRSAGQVLGHEAAFDGVDADLLQRLGELSPDRALSSSLARWARPRVQAKIEAIELVEVSLPFWCWR
jgi:hypothetical protein